jgi:hypothetical protein
VTSRLETGNSLTFFYGVGTWIGIGSRYTWTSDSRFITYIDKNLSLSSPRRVTAGSSQSGRDPEWREFSCS